MRKYKYIWLPAILSVYFLFMTFYFGMDLLRSGENVRFWATVGSELVVLVALSFFLKRREKLRMEREKDLGDTSQQRYKKL